jgi:acyl-CoA thioester hydrolase
MHKKFTIEEHVRWSDIDRAGIIFYGQFLRFFEIAETELFRAVGLSYSEVFDRLDIWLPRVQIHFDFRKPLMLDDLIEVSAFVGRFGTKSLTLNFAVNKKGEAELVAEGHITLACVNRSTFKSTPVPSEIIERLKPYAAE